MKKSLYIYIKIFLLAGGHSKSKTLQGFNIQIKHVFSCEAQEQKRTLLLKEHPDVLHCFEDVAFFKDGRGFCSKCQCNHSLSTLDLGIDLLIAGPSCKNLSRLSTKRKAHAGSYTSQDDPSGCSAITYQYGFRKVGSNGSLSKLHSVGIYYITIYGASCFANKIKQIYIYNI